MIKFQVIYVHSLAAAAVQVRSRFEWFNEILDRKSLPQDPARSMIVQGKLR